ncbi:hypothetical protein WKK05_08150 [Nostoc sp. UHCC 0302]
MVLYGKRYKIRKDVIKFDGVFADGIRDIISLTNGKLLIRDDLIVDGTTADLLTVSGKNETNIVFEISIGATVAIEGLTIADARQTSGDLFSYEDTEPNGTKKSVNLWYYWLLGVGCRV